MTSAKTTGAWVLIAVLSATALAGCLEREETITVLPDGQVRIRLEYGADSLEELETGDAMPSSAAGWEVTQRKVTEQKGPDQEPKEHFELDAESSFPPGAALPSNFAASDDPDADLYLKFPTTLTVEERPDGTYYHFRRVYPVRRNWAALDAIAKRALEGPEKRLGDKKNWTREDWSSVLGALVRIELAKKTAFARTAFRDLWPDAPQDQWLAVHNALHEITDELDGDRVAMLLAGANDDEASERALEAEAEAFEARALALMTSALKDATGCGEPGVREFTSRYERNKRHYEISKDLLDENFKIRVDMPGEIVSADADQIEGDGAKWSFAGADIRDGGVELMVTSRVAR